jgi:hypothetical protein
MWTPSVGRINLKLQSQRGKSITIKDGDNTRLEMANSLGDNVFDIWNKCMLDFILYGSFSLNLVFRKDRDMGYEMYYIDTSKLRAEKSDMHDRINNFYYSSDPYQCVHVSTLANCQVCSDGLYCATCQLDFYLDYGAVTIVEKTGKS